MKTQSIVLSFLFVFAALCSASAQKYPAHSLKKENIPVLGECGMCRKKIETASVQAGAAPANWNENSKVLSVSYNISKTNATAIQQAVAAAGYDTRDMKATDGAYDKLPGCCKYKRAAHTNSTVTGTSCNIEKACSKSDGCCKEGKCEKTGAVCTDLATCKEKRCCK